MANTNETALENKWWFRPAILCLAMLSANLLFDYAQISPREHGFFSATYLIYLFCWFGFERIFSTCVWLLLLLLKPDSRKKIGGADTNTQLQDSPPSLIEKIANK